MKRASLLVGITGMLAAALPLAGVSHALPLYRWVDATGSIHYTPSIERLPKNLQNQARDLETQMEETLEAPSPPDAIREPTAETPIDPARAAQIASLETAIKTRQETIKAMISAPAAPGSPPLAENPEFRSIAHELPGLQADLKALKDQPAPH